MNTRLSRLLGIALALVVGPVHCQAKQFAPQPALSIGETVSVTDLRVPPAAAKELQLSLKRFDVGDLRESVRHLEKAIRKDDRIPAAHQNLGVCYLRLKEYEKAASEFRRASELDPHMIQPRIGLTGTLFLLRRFPEAEEAAREAYQLEPTNPTARYLLSRIHAIEGHDTPEVREMLRASRSQFPAAHLVLASLLLKQNSTDDALVELREYLKRPDAPEKSKVACMIEKLTDPGSTSTCAMN